MRQLSSGNVTRSPPRLLVAGIPSSWHWHGIIVTCCVLLAFQVNPLAEDDQGNLIAADAKIGFDDNAEFRQKDVSLRAHAHRMGFVWKSGCGEKKGGGEGGAMVCGRGEHCVCGTRSASLKQLGIHRPIHEAAQHVPSWVRPPPDLESPCPMLAGVREA